MKRKLFFIILFGVGVFILVQIFMPFISFKFWELTSYNQNKSLISAASDQQVLGVSIENRDNFPAFVSNNKRANEAPYKEFTLSIPSLNLKNLNVVVDSNEFENNLAHLPASALPGEIGNVFITGHSSLPQLFKPSNYKAIFTNLSNIKKGDQIEVQVGGQTFVYQILGLKVIDPKDTSVINPPTLDGRYLTLMTCVPPGIFSQRLIVLAELKS